MTRPEAPAAAARAAIAVGVLLTLGVVGLHLQFHRHAGGLWRDEVNSVNVVSAASAADVLANLHYDSFPVGWVAVLYAWKSAGLADDDRGYRRLGLAIGLATVALLWWTGWRLGLGPPLVSLVLFGMSPSVIVYGGAVRGYGLASLTVVWLLGALWGFVDKPSLARAAVAQVAFLCAAQTHFAHLPVLFAIGVAAALCGWLGGKRRAAVAVLAMGVVAALVLLVVNWRMMVYMSTAATQEQGRWRPLSELLQVFAEALAPAADVLRFVWILAAAAAAAGFALAWSRPLAGRERTREVFGAVALAVAFVGTFAGYELLRLPTQYWYYLSLLPVCAFACEIGIAALAARFRRGAWARVALTGAAALLAAPGVAESVRLRMTSIDLAARAVETEARPQDLVVVFPWYCGITFDRYYRGPAPWITIPDLPDHRFHFHLAVREKMGLGETAVAPELARVESTLRQGGRVWVVGAPVAPDPGAGLPALPAPLGSGMAGDYLQHWELQLGSLLEEHAREGHKVLLPDVGAVNAWENLPLYVVEGWR